MPCDRAKLLDLFFYHSFMNLFWLAVFCFCTIFFATWLTFNWIKAKIVAKEGGVKWHKVETLLGGIVILHWKLPREERGWGNWPAILFRKPLSCTSGAFRIHLIYISRCSKLFLYQPSKPEIMKLFGKKTEDIVPERKNVWSIVIQVLIAALTALSGVFAGCSLASAWQWRQEEISMWGALDVFK